MSASSRTKQSAIDVAHATFYLLKLHWPIRDLKVDVMQEGYPYLRMSFVFDCPCGNTLVENSMTSVEIIEYMKEPRHFVEKMVERWDEELRAHIKGDK